MAESMRRKPSAWIFILTLISLQQQSCSAASPPPPVQLPANRESCHLTNYRGEWEDQMPCKAAIALFPKTESEFIHAVAYAVREEKKIKVITTHWSRNDDVFISTRDYNSRIMIDEKSMKVTVDVDVELRKLLDALAAKGLALPHTTDWDGLSMAGVITTTAHGSSLWGKGGGIYEYIVGTSIVVPAPAAEGYAKIIHLAKKDEEIKAARVSLGVFVAISQVTFLVEEMFKRSVTLELKDDSDLENAFVKFAKLHEFGGMLQSATVPRVTERGSRFLSNWRRCRALHKARQPELNNAKVNASNLCKSAKTQVEQGVKAGNGYLNDGKTYTRFPVVGYTH